MSNDLIEALVTEAEPQMFPQMLGTADADFTVIRLIMVLLYSVVLPDMKPSIRITVTT